MNIIEKILKVANRKRVSEKLAFDQSDIDQLLQAVSLSLNYLNTPSAQTDYRDYPIEGVTLDRVRNSLLHFQSLLASAQTATELQAAVLEEFDFYQAAGNDGQGTVEFTGYFTPIYNASRTPTAEYRYPLFQRPQDLAKLPEPHPTRLELEGADGLQWQQNLLADRELVWLRDRLEAFLIQVQGSAPTIPTPALASS